MAINYFVNFTTYDGWAVSGNFSVDYSSNPPILVAHNINAVGLSNINYNQGQSFLAAINSLGAGVYYLRIDNYDYSVLDVLYRDDGSNGGSIILDNSNTGYHSPFGTDGGASDGTISEAVASITSAAYDASTGTLTVTGSNLTTSAGDDINASRLTITGQSGSSYTLTNALFADTSSSTSFTVMLSNTDKLNVNGLLNKNGTSSVNSTTFNLAGSAGWHVANPSAADLTGNSITVSNVVAPTIASGQYDASTGVLTVTGSNLVRQVGASNDISVNKLTLFGEGPASLTLTSSDVEIISGTSFAVTLNASDRAYINQFLNKNGTSSSSGTTYNLYASDDWNTSITGSNIADTSNPLTVINVPTPTITSATYDATTGTLTVTGANLTTSASADIISSRLIVTGQDSSTYALTDTADAEIISSTSFTVMLSSTDKLNVNGLLNRAGTSSVGGTTFNLAGSAGWHSANPSAADLTSNGITVSNVVAPSITSGQYDASTGVLTVTGSNLVKQVGSSNDISVNKLTLRGEGLENFTLTSSNVEITSGTAFAVTLNALDRAYINTLLNKNGTSSTSGSTYTLSADDDWNTSITGSNIADASNALTVSNVSIPTITSASYNASTGVLVVTGAGFLQRSGANNDIDVSKFSIRGQGGSRHSLTSANVEITSGTSFTVTLNSTDVAAVAPLLNRNGTSSSDSTTYSLEASEDWARGADSSVVVADSSGNGITVTSVDTTPPSAPSRPYLSTASDSGTSSSDNITSDSTPTLTGTAESYSLVTVYDTDGSTVLGTATADGAGNWSVTTSVMSEGSHTLTSKAADAMGNISTTSAGLEIVIDSTAPSAPSTPDLSAISDSGTSNTDNITSVSTPTLTGTAEAGSVVTVYDTDGSTVLGTATATDGIWSVTTSNLSDGVHILTSKEMDTAGNTSSASAGLVIVIDSAAQGVDSINRVTGQLTSGASVDFTVSFAEAVTGVDINDFLLSSTGSADGTIAAVSQLSASTYTVSVNTINGDGSLRLDLKSVGTGITDIAGNAITTGFSSGQTYTIDTTVPTVTSFSPTDGATNVAVGSNVVSSFSEAIQRGSGAIFLRSGSSTGTIIEQFNASTSDRLSLDGSTLTIDPTANLASDTQYFVTFDAGTLRDLAGNNFAGTASYDFRTIFIDTTAPTVTSFSPSDGAIDVAVGSNVVSSFSEAIQRGTGTIFLRSGSSTGTIIEQFNAATSDRLSIDGSTLTIDPTANLASDTQYFVTFDAGSLQDLAGNNFVGTSSYDFRTVFIDSTAPTATSFSPSDGATNVAVGSNVVSSFSEAIQRGTGTIFLRSGSSTGMIIEQFNAATSDRLSIDGSTLTIDPTANLAGDTQYFVTFDAGTVQDLAGNNFVGTSSYDFRTVFIDTTAPTVTSFSPSDGAIDVAVGSNVVSSFSEAIQRGTGIIYLRAGSSTGTIIEQFNAATSDRLSLDGSILTIDPTANLASDTQYFVTFEAGTVQDLAGNNFAGTSSYDFRTVFIDSTAPTATSFSPSDGATNVAVGSNVVSSFSEAIQRGTGTIFLRSGSSTGTIIEQFNAATSDRLSLDGSTLTIDPTANLASDTQYFVTFDAGSLQDLAGNNFVGTSSYDFRTVFIDTTGPTVTSFSPSDGAIDVAFGSNVVSSFSEAIQRGTGTIFLRSGSSTGTIIEQFNAATSDRLSLDGSTLTIDPTANLAGDTQYFVTFDAGTVQDLAGNNFAGTSSYDFRTVFQVSYSLPSSSIQSIGFTPDGQSLLIKTGGRVSSVVLGTSLEFTDQVLSTSDLINTMTPLTAFQSSGAVSGYTLPEIFTGDASLNLQYQLIEAADNAVVIGSQYNDFIKLASTNSQGKAVNGGGGNDVIDGGVGSTFITGSGTSANSTTYFLDGRAPGISWSTITDFKLDVDKVTIWGFVKGVSSVDTSFANFNTDGAGGYEGLTLHFKNLLPSGQTSGSNPNLNSITLSGRTLEEFGASSLTELNNQINNQTNPNFLVGSTQDSFGTHEYLFIN